MADERKDNCEVSMHSPIGGYGTTDNTGPGILSGAVSHPGRETGEETGKGKGLLKRIKDSVLKNDD